MVIAIYLVSCFIAYRFNVKIGYENKKIKVWYIPLINTIMGIYAIIKHSPK